MKRILNLLIVGGTFYIGMEYFSKYIYINSIQTLIITSVLMVVMSAIVGGVVRSLLKSMTEAVERKDVKVGGGIGCFLVFFILPFGLMITPIRLWILEAMFNDSFVVNGFWTYILLSFIFAIFNVNTKSEE